MRRLARRPTYAALRVYQRDGQPTLEAAILRDSKGQPLRPKWPPLVSAETFWACYRLLTDPSRRTTRPGRGTYLLSSLATCGKCGGKMIRRLLVSGREQYLCREYGCVGIDKQALDDFASERVVAWLSDPAVAAQIAGGADSAAAQQARAEVARAESELEEWVRLAERGEVSAAAFARVERAKRAVIEAGRAQLAETAAPPMVAANLGQRAAEGWAALDVGVRRQIVQAVCAIEVMPVGRAHGANGAVPPVYRVRWRWLLGPGAGTVIEPLSWTEHKADEAELRTDRALRRDYVSAERRAAIEALLREDPERADREVARLAGRIDRHAIRAIRHDLEQSAVIPVIRRPDRWRVINHGFVTTGHHAPGGPAGGPAVRSAAASGQASGWRTPRQAARCAERGRQPGGHQGGQARARHHRLPATRPGGSKSGPNGCANTRYPALTASEVRL